MDRPNLMLKFELNRNREIKTEHATRIKIEGRGCLLVYGDSAATPKTICLEDLRGFSIRSLPESKRRLGNPPIPVGFGSLSGVSVQRAKPLRIP
jgi:hypothetical protein